MTDRITVLIVDDHEVVRIGLRALVDAQEDMEVVAESGSAGETLTVARAKRPSVVFLDLQLPYGSDIELCSKLCRELPDTVVVVLTAYTSNELVGEAIAGGATGFVLKEVGSDELLRAIRAIRAGANSAFDPASADKLVQHFRELHAATQPRALEHLTRREFEVFATSRGARATERSASFSFSVSRPCATASAQC